MRIKLILIRAAITPAEWKTIRHMAVEKDTPTAELVAQALRRTLLRPQKG